MHSGVRLRAIELNRELAKSQDWRVRCFDVFENQLCEFHTDFYQVMTDIGWNLSDATSFGWVLIDNMGLVRAELKTDGTICYSAVDNSQSFTSAFELAAADVRRRLI